MFDADGIKVVGINKVGDEVIRSRICPVALLDLIAWLTF